MQTGYVYLILADKVTCDFLKSAMEEYEAQRWREEEGKDDDSEDDDFEDDDSEEEPW